jgi:hypothetical protein
MEGEDHQCPLRVYCYAAIGSLAPLAAAGVILYFLK